MKSLKSYAMKLPVLITLVLFFTAMFTSCKKDKADDGTANNTSLAGKWAGKRGDGNETPDYDYRFTIKSNGTLDATNAAGGIKGSGTWTLVGTEFKAQYKFVAPLFTDYQIKGTYNAATGKLTGVWGFDDGLYEEGTWYLSKLQ